MLATRAFSRATTAKLIAATGSAFSIDNECPCQRRLSCLIIICSTFCTLNDISTSFFFSFFCSLSFCLFVCLFVCLYVCKSCKTCMLYYKLTKPNLNNLAVACNSCTSQTIYFICYYFLFRFPFRSPLTLSPV